jgi:hypothetical protein
MDSTTGTTAGSPFSQQDAASFTKWGETVKATAPANAVPYATLPS